MERVIYLDTHAVLWLYAGEISLFPAKALRLIEEADVKISPIVQLELQYLYEVERIKVAPERILNTLISAVNLKICSQNFEKVAAASLKQSWTRDPFDRIIVAQASLADAALVTKDELIRKHYKKAMWD